MMMWDDGFGWGWIGFGLLHMLLFWGLIILVIVALVKWLRIPAGNPRTALEILQERYARGDIEREEYQRKAADLRSREAADND